MSENVNCPFDPQKAARELAQSCPAEPVRRLPFYAQCAAFYALYNGIAPHIVAKAFGVTPGTISYLGGCLRHDTRRDTVINGDLVKTRSLTRARDPGRLQRYRRVAQEFTDLGEQEFAARYYTDAIHVRLMKVKHDVDDEAARRARRGCDPTADSHAGPFKDQGDVDCAIVWLDDPPGWYVQGPHTSFGRELREGGERRPFKTSKQAFESAQL